MEVDMAAAAHEDEGFRHDNSDTEMGEESSHESGFFERYLEEYRAYMETSNDDVTSGIPQEPKEETSRNTEDTVRVESNPGSIGGRSDEEDCESDETVCISAEPGGSDEMLTRTLLSSEAEKDQRRSPSSLESGEVRSEEDHPDATGDEVTSQENPNDDAPNDTPDGDPSSDLAQDFPEVDLEPSTQPAMEELEPRNIHEPPSTPPSLTPREYMSAPQQTWVILDVQPFDPVSNEDAGSLPDEVHGPDNPSDMRQDSQTRLHVVQSEDESRVREDVVAGLIEHISPRMKLEKSPGRTVLEACIIALRKAPEDGLRLQELAYLATQVLKEKSNKSGNVYDDDMLARTVESHLRLEHLQKCCLSNESVSESRTDFVSRFAVSLCIRRANASSATSSFEG